MLKPVFTILLGIFLFNTAFAQRGIAVYYLKNNGALVSTRDSAEYFVVVLPPDTSSDKKMFIVKGYYPDGKIKFNSGSYSSKLGLVDPKSKGYYKPVLQGGYISYFPNGRRMSSAIYENGELVGDEVSYYPNGKLYTIKTYTNDKKIICNECRDSTGKALGINGNGRCIKYIDESFNNYVEGELSGGLEEGEWLGKQGDTVNIAWGFKDGKKKYSAIIDNSGRKIYTFLDVIPQFKGGIENFFRFLAHNIRYPALAQEYTVVGRVVLSFIVEEDGRLSNIKVLKSPSPLLSAEAIRVIKLSPAWQPGTLDGKPVPSVYNVPIQFSLAH